MKFRLSVQPQPRRQDPELKSVAPSLLADPAFSPDPQSNPYFVTGEPAWASSPPVGHPPLKNKKQRQPSNFAESITSADFDVQLIQPPNSPVAPSAIPNHRSPPSLNPRTPVVGIAAADSSHPQPPPQKSRMHFLSRRKVSQPPVTAPAIVQLHRTDSSLPLNDVTQRPDLRPAHGTRYLSEPAKVADSRPSLPPRPATTGASTPSSRSTISTTTPGSGASQGPSQDLDRVDELDETNPWGISLHHRGPYEAAVQAIRRSDNRMPLGSSNSILNDYPRQAMYAHGNLYVPPQAPMGVSLNLSPGQILPRNFHLQPGYHPPTREIPGPPLPQMMFPPSLSSGPHPRHQSLSPPAASIPNSQPTIHLEESRDSRLKLEREPEKLVNTLSFSVGMAMLQSETSASSSHSILLDREAPNEQDFDPYDPIHLEKNHSPSPLVTPTLERSRESSPVPKPQCSTPEPVVPGNNNINHRPGDMSPNTGLISAQLNHQKPLSPTRPQDQSRNSSRNPSPGPLTNAENLSRSTSDENGSSGQEVVVSLGKGISNISPLPPNQHAASRDSLVSPAPVVSQQLVRSPVPHTVQERMDGRSTHHSISTYASNQSRNRAPPPHRRVPKHLVMPAPLNKQPTQYQPSSGMSQPSFRAPFVPVQVHMQSKVHVPHPQAPSVVPTMRPRAQEIQMSAGRKLRKRVSTFTAPNHATIPSTPIVTTVSFAPPIIGSNYSPANEKGIARSRMEKIPKRVLSKRRTDL